jgi:4-amino-4-deoxy-L-arabinose transferase-like glycosyltransferase
MSRDFDLLISTPLSLVWNPTQEASIDQQYRELNAPVTKLLIGAGRLLGGFSPLPHDWDWSKTWQENADNSALPSPALLLISRLSVAWLFPFSVWLVYDTARQLDHWLTGLLSAGLFATSALILLHTRRAMAESTLVFGVCMALWCLVKYRNKPWLVAAAMAVAFNTKQTNLALVPVGLFAVAWTAWVRRQQIRDALKPALIFCLTFTVITFGLNPFLWSNPILASLAAIRARQTLLTAQVAATGALLPSQVLTTPGEHAAALLANLFLTPPAVEDVGNYIQQTAASKAAYFNLPGTNLFRGLAGGAVMLALALAGVFMTLRQFFAWKIKPQLSMAFFLLAFLAQTALLTLTIPLPYQRYWLPLVPFFCVWSALPLSRIGITIAGVFTKKD